MGGAGEDAKTRGNALFSAKEYDEAIKEYTEAIKLEPDNPVYYSNRSACYFSKKDFSKALEDARICVEKDGSFIKGYLRLVSAQIELGKYDEADSAIKKALEVDPSNELLLRKQGEMKMRKAGGSTQGNGKSGGLSSPPKRVVPNNLNHQQLEIALHQAKGLIHQAFRTNDFKTALRICDEAKAFAVMLPEPRASAEVTQIMLRTSSLHAQMGDFGSAITLCESCLERANRWFAMRGEDKSEAQGMVMSCHGMHSNLMLTTGQVGEAEASAKRALDLANELFPGDDPKRFRAVRCMAQVHEKQGRLTEANEGFTCAYELLLKQGNPQDQEFMMALDDLINFLMTVAGKTVNAIEVSRAIELAQKHCDALRSQKDAAAKKGGRSDDEKKRDELILGDMLMRLALLKVRRNPAESEVLVREVLVIREKIIGADSPAVGQTLVGLSEFMEMQGKIGSDNELLLLRALAIYEKAEGSKSPNVPKLHEKIARMRARREGRELPYVLDDDDLRGSDTTQPGVASKSSSSPAAKKPASSTIASKPENGSSSQEKKARTPPTIPEFKNGDGATRFQVAVRLLQDEFFEEGAPIAQEAYEIFAKQFGEEDHRTQAAKRNAMIARQRFIDGLWEQVYQEQLQELEKRHASKSVFGHDAGSNLGDLSGQSSGCTIS